MVKVARDKGWRYVPFSTPNYHHLSGR